MTEASIVSIPSSQKNGPFLISIMLLCVIACSTLSIHASSAEQGTQDLQPITVQLKWKHQFQFAGFYAAIEQGFYEKSGFDVTLKEASFDTNPIQEVLEKRADYSVANSELALYRLKGQPVSALAVFFQRSPIVLMTLSESNIYGPIDLVNKRVMYPEGHYGANTLGIMLREGISVDQFESVPLSFNLDDLINRKVDAMVGYITDQPYSLQQRGVDYRLIDPRTYGIDFYGDTLFTREDRIIDHPDEVSRFREATLAGWRYAIKHPEEIIQLLIEKYRSHKNQAELAYEAQKTIELIVPNLVEIGHMNPGRWHHIAETFKDLGMAEGAFTTEGFLYQPEDVRFAQQQSNIIAAVIISIAIILVAFGFLVAFNHKLRLLVERKTRDLIEKNTELERSQALLRQKEKALSLLNKELEAKVEERTLSLHDANNSLLAEINYRKQKELSLELLHEAIASSQSAVLIIDRQRIINYASVAFIKLMGFEKNQLIGRSFSTLQNLIELPTLFNDQFLEITNFKVFSEVYLNRDSDEDYWLQISVSPMSLEGSGISHFVIVGEDISALKQSKDKLEKMALYDSLTNLDNRALFHIRLEKAIQRAQRSGAKTALLFIDIDHFKSINDSFGHEVGDKILQRAAERLKSSVRTNDPVARISGDEFTILLGDIHSYNDASKVAEHIIQAFNEPVKVDSQEVFVTTSIGISITPDDATQDDELIRNADMAMYQAKQQGRNNFQFYSADMNQEIQFKRNMEIELMNGLDNDAFFLLYQPKINLQTGRLVGIEALLRWRFSETVIRLPDEFISIAEETGVIVPLGYQVISKAIEGLSWLCQHGFGDLKMALNVSARQIKDQAFVSGIETHFEQSTNLITQFELEITENAFIDENEDNLRRLNQLRDLGFSISIDDFGTGYSSLTYLQKLPIDTLKIDRSFIAELPDNPQHARLSSTIIAMANNMNLTVIAEGVESEAQAAFLRDSHCDIAQGFLYGKPMSLKELVLAFADQKTA